jgi:hypothetical protein
MTAPTCTACGAADHDNAAHCDLAAAQRVLARCIAANDADRALAWRAVLKKLEHAQTRAATESARALGFRP